MREITIRHIILFFFLLNSKYCNSSLKVSTIERFEEDLFKEIQQNTKGNTPQMVYFNKGL